jgi:hypothetical protein
MAESDSDADIVHDELCRFDATYIIPVKWGASDEPAHFDAYLSTLSQWITVIVVDGSPPEFFVEHDRRWNGLTVHLPVAGPVTGNGKVAGVMTGVRAAQHHRLVIADDDVRYDRETLSRVLDQLENHDIVRPQNYFLNLPWHARWDTARTLINRAFDADFPGTLAVRRDLLLATDGYDGAVLFENLELIRTIRAAGGRELKANGIFVGREPPTAVHFLRQRIRQAYDDFAQPPRLAAELALLPLLLLGLRRPRIIAVILVTAVLSAEIGRRRDNGPLVFRPTSSLWAPAWVIERAACVWIAVAQRFRGGVVYSGSRLFQAATPYRRLRERHREVRKKQLR